MHALEDMVALKDMNTFSATAAMKSGWEIFKKRPWFLVGALVVFYAIFIVLSGILDEISQQGGIFSISAAVINFVIQMIVGMGLTAFLLKAHDSIDTAELTDLWHPRPFWRYVGASLLNGLIVVGGLILLIIPGLMWLVTFLFTPYIVIDKGLMPVEALKESARITKGDRWPLFWLFLLIIGVNILGAIALFIGLLVSIPVTSLALVHAYRELSRKVMPAPIQAPTPSAAPTPSL